MSHWRCGSGTFRMNVALAELPDFTCLPGRSAADHHTAGIIIAPTLAYMERAYFDARPYGWSRQPIVELVIPSTLDDTLAPPGQHVASLFCQHVAPTLPDGASWDAHREDGGRPHDRDRQRATRPNFKAAVLGRQIMSPLDLERTFGLVGGDIFHGALSLDQLFSRAPDARLRQLPRSARRAVHVRRRHASGRRRHRRARAQRGARDPRGLPPRAPAARRLKRMARAARKPRFERQLPQVRRQALIAATIECLKRYGHEGLSIRTISAQAGVSVGLINHHFPNKDELVAAAYRHFNAELVGGMQAAVARAADAPQARMRAFLEASFSPPNLDADTLAVWVVFWGMYRHSRPIQRVHRETYQGYVQLLHGMLAELLGEGAAPRGRRPRRSPPRWTCAWRPSGSRRCSTGCGSPGASSPAPSAPPRPSHCARRGSPACGGET